MNSANLQLEGMYLAIAAIHETLIAKGLVSRQDVEGGDDKMIVAGPVTDRAQAEQLCVRMDRVGIPCKPTPFQGEPLPLLN